MLIGNYIFVALKCTETLRLFEMAYEAQQGDTKQITTCFMLYRQVALQKKRSKIVPPNFQTPSFL